MNSLLNVFPFVANTMSELDSQNKLLNRVTLTGKIVALHVASTLFEFTDTTAITFNEIQEELVEALLGENVKKLNAELESKAQIAIDILIRNLFERTADVGFLATDSVIVDFLTTDAVEYSSIQKRLEEYVAKYSVYNEIVVFDTDGNVKVNINPNNYIKNSQDMILKEALSSDSYIERYAYTDIFKTQEKTLVYVQKIEAHGQNIGVLCLCFKFEDELKLILKNLGTENEVVCLADNKGLIASSNSYIKEVPTYKNIPYQLVGSKEVAVTVKTNGYQGYSGIESWYGVSIGHTQNQSHSSEAEEKPTTSVTLNEKLSAIIEKADALVEDLNDVIINGELIASKRKVYVLHPILDNLRAISSSLLEIIKSSVKNLEDLISASLVHDASISAHLAIDIMDRNLYERANDSRWWALTPLFKNQLIQKEPDVSAMNDTLKYINELYTVYTNLFVYDKQGNVIAASNDQSIIGKSFDDPLVKYVLGNKNTQNYYVSQFQVSPFYEQKPTYIYNATISYENKTVGGIGIVFDAEVEFQAMLKESFPNAKEGFSLFVDTHKTIIASSSDSYKPLQMIDIDDKFVNPKMKTSVNDYITIDGKNYIVASAISKGYREYKTQDNYKNTLFAIVFILL
ncbi:cache domain-containing protein [Sulfurimonas sp.]|uniref:cache domain-containing protein n=1 Tax=Sulfurimonas sp. TaxID=2022749 RepID=UPI003D123E28